MVGPSSLMMALMASGLNGQCFAFTGYLPVKTPARREALLQLERTSARLGQSQIIIETPYRNDSLLADILECCKPSTRLCIAADITCPDDLIAVQIPAVQTRIVNKVTETLSKNLDGRVEVGRVLISFPNNIILKDVNVIQGAGDTIATLGKALVSLKTTSLVFSEQALVRRVSLEDGSFTIRHLTDSTTNLSALLAPMPHNESGELVLPWDEIRVNKVTLKNIDFSTVNPGA